MTKPLVTEKEVALGGCFVLFSQTLHFVSELHTSQTLCFRVGEYTIIVYYCTLKLCIKNKLIHTVPLGKQLTHPAWKELVACCSCSMCFPGLPDLPCLSRTLGLKALGRAALTVQTMHSELATSWSSLQKVLEDPYTHTRHYISKSELKCSSKYPCLTIYTTFPCVCFISLEKFSWLHVRTVDWIFAQNHTCRNANVLHCIVCMYVY